MRPTPTAAALGVMLLFRRFCTHGLAPTITLAITLALVAPRRASADVITIDDGGLQGTASFPFTCSLGQDSALWLPTMGFVYRNVEPFQLSPGDTIAFDIQMRPGDPDDLGFRPQLDIALAHASDPTKPFKPDDLPGSDFTIVSRDAASGPGNRAVRDYDLVYTVDKAYSFPGGGLIIRVSNPQGVLAIKTDVDCLPVITADMAPTGTNRLVGTFQMQTGEYPWTFENTMNMPGVPYVRIRWTRCGDGFVSGSEACDDGNTDNNDACSNQCTINVLPEPACGDGVVQAIEECDNSANPDHPDPFCDDHCHFAAFAKGSGCSAGGAGAGVVAALLLVAFARRRRAAAAVFMVIALRTGSAEAQLTARTDGFRVDRFELAPSVEDGLVVQDPRVLGHMVWSVSAGLGYTNTLLRVVPKLSSDTGVDVVGTRLSAYLDFAMGLGKRFEVDVALPFALAQSTGTGTAAGIMLKRPGTTALGDARLGGSVLLYGTSETPNLGLAAGVAIPIGSESSFTSDGKLGGEAMATAALPGRGYRVMVNAGVRLRPKHDYVSTDQGTELVGRAGLFVPIRQRVTTSLEFDLSTRASGSEAFRAIGSPILAILGGRYQFDGGIRAGAGIGAGLTAAPGSPAVRVVFVVGYSPEPVRPRRLTPTVADRDGDGIPDNLDKCPDKPEDFNGVEDEDGCPDAYDRDKDRVTDTPPPYQPETLEDVVTMPAPIEFKFDTAIMLPGAEVYLHRVLEILKKHPDVLKIEVQGHTSSEGGPEYNMRLSNARARAVYDWLVEHGIAADRLVPRGYGLTQPLFPNDSEPNRQRNRRVQFRLLQTVPGSNPLGTPTQPAPTQPAPTQPAPAQPAPTQPAPPAPAPPAPAPSPPESSTRQ
jgi:cysteine-rich repeat protein